jgi:hypothetical protein
MANVLVVVRTVLISLPSSVQVRINHAKTTAKFFYIFFLKNYIIFCVKNTLGVGAFCIYFLTVLSTGKGGGGREWYQSIALAFFSAMNPTSSQGAMRNFSSSAQILFVL